MFLGALGLGFGIPVAVVLDREVRSEFEALTWQIPTRVFARPLAVVEGQPMSATALQQELEAAAFSEGDGRTPGTFQREGGVFRIATRGFRDVDGPVDPARAEVRLANGRVAGLRREDGGGPGFMLDPARIATLYGAKQEERELIRLDDAPPLLVAGLQAVMPMPPLALQDEVSLSLSMHVAEQTRKDLAAEGRTVPEHPGMAVIRQLCEAGRIGKKARQGFYDYTDDGKRLWPGLAELFPVAATQPDQRELIDRLMFAQANEAARCLEEGVLRSVADGNIGSIFGWGFAPFRGGALQFIDTVGVAAFVARARELAAAHGPRFEPAAMLVRLAETGERVNG